MDYNPVFITKKGNKQIRSRAGYVLMTYPNIPRNLKFKHLAVNDHNQNLCDGWHLYPPIEFEEVNRVCQGLKPVGVSWTRSLESARLKATECLKKGYLATYGKYESHNPELYFITVSVTGKLGDYFDMKTLAGDYEQCGIHSGNIKRYEDVNFVRFHHGKYDVEDHPMEIVGLILGYPIENTISLIKRDMMYYLKHKKEIYSENI